MLTSLNGLLKAKVCVMHRLPREFNI